MTNTQLFELLSQGLVDTIWIIIGSSFVAYAFGFPLGVLIT
ncbi:MAG: methionine ABC transporter permease, partial [Erysipelotrichaceae bacterium]|nr:methionine ABC transporter permease [Erysipelotrichaceae bacterium]